MDAEDLSSGSRADTLLLEVTGQHPEGTPLPPVMPLFPQLPSHVFCGRGLLWWCFVLLLLFSVLSSYLRERWVCSFSSVLKGFIIPGVKHQFGHFGRDRGMQPVKSPDSKSIRPSGASSLPWSLMLVEGKQIQGPSSSHWASQDGLSQATSSTQRPGPGPPCQGRAPDARRIGTFWLTKPEARSLHRELQASSGTPAGKSRCQCAGE